MVELERQMPGRHGFPNGIASGLDRLAARPVGGSWSGEPLAAVGARVVGDAGKTGEKSDPGGLTSGKRASADARSRGTYIPAGTGIEILAGIPFLSLAGIWDPTPRIEAKILGALGKIETDCGSVAPVELAEIKTLQGKHHQSLPALKDGDFDD